jgi:hypothetical protein
MRKSGIIITLVASVIGSTALTAKAVPDELVRSIHVETGAWADSVTVGQRLGIYYEVTYPDSLEFVPPERVATGNSKLLAMEWSGKTEEGRTTRTAHATVFTLDLERAHVPAMPLVFRTPGGDTVTVFTDEVVVPVRQVAAAESSLKPLKPQWQAPRSLAFLLYMLIALAAVAALLVLFLRKRRRKPAEVERRIELPADVVALEALMGIEQMKLLEKRYFKRYYTLVVDTVRKYLENRFGIEAMDRTTQEILNDLADSPVAMDLLEPLMREADLVKFAKFEPDFRSGEQTMALARGVIERVSPQPAAVSE